MFKGEYEVSPYVLEKREFPFSEYQLLQIKTAKKFNRNLRALVYNSGGQTHLFHLELI